MKEEIKMVWSTISIQLVSAVVMLLPDLWSALEREDRILNKLVLWRHIFPLIWTDRNQINLNIWDTVLSDVFQYKSVIKSLRALSVGGPVMFGFVGEGADLATLVLWSWILRIYQKVIEDSYLFVVIEPMDSKLQSVFSVSLFPSSLKLKVTSYLTAQMIN